MYKTTSIVFFIVIIISGINFYVFPSLALIIITLNLVFTLLLSFFKLYLLSLKGQNVIYSNNYQESAPFVSIHLAAYKEPVEEVKKTIYAAANQDYKNYEVVVLYNNTKESRFWEPIKEYCKGFNNVLFYNASKVEGFKAGALNLCLDLMDVRTDLIFTLDADYILNGNAISTAVIDYNNHNVSLLQFPQAYNNHSVKNALANEYAHYFKVYSKTASVLKKNLPTGTLTLVSKKCIEKLGGWPEESITEDAYLGIELIKNNCEISYSDKVIGRGLMPNCKKDLKIQRMRWIFGNFQTFIHTIKIKSLKIKTKILLSSQLFSWINLNGLPWIYIFLVSIWCTLGYNIIQTYILLISVSIIIVHSLTQLTLFNFGSNNLKDALLSYLIHMASSIEGAYTWWGYFLRSDRPFDRTSKFYNKIGFDYEQFLFNSILSTSGLLLVLNSHEIYGVLIIIFSMFRFVSRIFLHSCLKETNQISFSE